MNLDTSAAPELALLAMPPTAFTPAAIVAGAAMPGTARPGTVVPESGCPGSAGRAWPGTATGTVGPGGPVTVGYLAACLRLLAADPRRWWDLARFDPQHPVRIPVTTPVPGCETWLLVLPARLQRGGRRSGTVRWCELPGRRRCYRASRRTGRMAGAPGLPGPDSGTWRPRPVPADQQRPRLRGHVAGSPGPASQSGNGLTGAPSTSSAKREYRRKPPRLTVKALPSVPAAL